MTALSALLAVRLWFARLRGARPIPSIIPRTGFLAGVPTTGGSYPYDEQITDDRPLPDDVDELDDTIPLPHVPEGWTLLAGGSDFGYYASCGRCESALRLCDRCGVPSRMQRTLPMPFGSVNASRPRILCGSCHEHIVALVNAEIPPA